MGMLINESRDCTTCHGTGKTFDHRTHREVVPHEPCHACFGTGDELTALGQEFMQLLKDHYQLVPKR